MKVKSLDDIITKWKNRSSIATPEYEAGIRDPSRPWMEATLDAEETYKAAVIAAANAGRFGIGVRSAGNDAWFNACIEKGVQRFAQGVALAAPAYEKGFRPYHKALSALVLTPRRGRGDERNLLRVAEVAKRLNEIRLAGGS